MRIQLRIIPKQSDYNNQSGPLFFLKNSFVNIHLKRKKTYISGICAKGIFLKNYYNYSYTAKINKSLRSWVTFKGNLS